MVRSVTVSLCSGAGCYVLTTPMRLARVLGNETWSIPHDVPQTAHTPPTPPTGNEAHRSITRMADHPAKPLVDFVAGRHHWRHCTWHPASLLLARLHHAGRSDAGTAQWTHVHL